MRKCLESSSCRLYRRAHGVEDTECCASEDGFILSIVNSSRGLGGWGGGSVYTVRFNFGI